MNAETAREVVDVHGITTMKRLSDFNRVDINDLANLIRKQKVVNVAPLPDRMMVFPLKGFGLARIPRLATAYGPV